MLALIESISQNEREIKDSEKLDKLIFAIAQKDKIAFEELYKLTNTAVYAYALSILKNEQDAQDVMHDCYLSIYSSAKLYASSSKPMAWIIVITKNLCLKKINERKRTAELCENTIFTFESDSKISTENKLIIEKCMNNLSDDERNIVILHAVAGFKHREIAQHLNMLLPTVLSKYNRAIKKLQTMLEQEGS